MSNEEVIWHLEQWGLWSRQDGTGRLSNTSSAMFYGLIPNSNDESVLITDEKAMEIDECICALDFFNREAWLVLIMKYYYNMTTTSISRRMGKGRPKVQSLAETGEAFVAAFLTK